MPFLKPEGTTAAGLHPAGSLDGPIRFGTSGLHRIIILSHTGSLYGAGRSLLELVRSLRQMELEVGVVLPADGLLGSALQLLQCKLWHMHLPSWVQARTEGLTSTHTLDRYAPAARQLCSQIGVWKPDLLWTNSSITPVGAMAAESLGIPHVWHLRELNGTEYPYEFCVGAAEVTELIGAADIRVAVSHTVKAFYESLGCGQCEWIYNGIGSASCLDSRQTGQMTGDVTRLVNVGRVSTFKKTATAIAATATLSDMGYPVILRVVGGGDIESYRNLANTLGIGDRVEFTGFEEQVDKHYRWADIMLSCASHEAMGRSTAEAMSWGLPIAGHHAAGTGELVSRAGGGLLYDGSAADLARVIASLIEDPASAKRLGEAGQRWARAHASSEQHAIRIRDLIKSMNREKASHVHAKHCAIK